MAEDHAIHEGDCLAVMETLKSETVQLAYLDPPFFSQKIHRLRTRDRRKEFAFDDMWSSHREYAEFLHSRVKETHRLLARNGSVFFHCDHRARHIARAILDEIFGCNLLRSEIVWYYRRWSNSRKGLLRTHQTILYYSKSSEFTFNTQWTDYSPSTNVDQILQQRERDAAGKSIYKRDGTGQTIANGGKRGVPLGDVWDIPYLNPKARERTGYPTQKPILLLEQILKIASNEDDCILDPFCGSGTTLVAAKMMKRRSIGIDISKDAVALSRDRLQRPVRSDSHLLAQGRESYRSADQASLALLGGIPFVPVHRNKGIDAILKGDYEGTPVAVRVQRRGETVAQAAQKLKRACAAKHSRLMFLVATEFGNGLPFEDDVPHDIIVVQAPGLAMLRILDEGRWSGSKVTLDGKPAEARSSKAVG